MICLVVVIRIGMLSSMHWYCMHLLRRVNRMAVPFHVIELIGRIEMINVYWSKEKNTYVKEGIEPVGFISFTIEYSAIPKENGMVVLNQAVAVIVMEHFKEFMTFCVWNPDEFEYQFGFRPGIECGLGPVINGAREHFKALSVL